MKHAVNEAIQRANAELNNVALPNYTHVMDVLRYLLQQASLSDLEPDNHAMGKAREVVDIYTSTV